MSEMLVDRGLGVGALGPQKRHLERFLLGEARRHDLAKRRAISRGAVPDLVPRRAQHLGLAIGTIEIDGVPGGVLGNADALRKLSRRLMSACNCSSRASISARSVSSPSRSLGGARARRRALSAFASHSVPWSGTHSVVPAGEIVHESDQRLDTVERHGIVDTDAHAADGAVSPEVGQPRVGRLPTNGRPGPAAPA